MWVLLVTLITFSCLGLGFVLTHLYLIVLVSFPVNVRSVYCSKSPLTVGRDGICNCQSSLMSVPFFLGFNVHSKLCPIFFFLFYFIFKLYNIVLVLPYIEMNPPQAYMCSPSWTLLPPPSCPVFLIQVFIYSLFLPGEWHLSSLMPLFLSGSNDS